MQDETKLHLSEEQINKIITLNGGHTHPTKSFIHIHHTYYISWPITGENLGEFRVDLVYNKSLSKEVSAFVKITPSGRFLEEMRSRSSIPRKRNKRIQCGA